MHLIADFSTSLKKNTAKRYLNALQEPSVDLQITIDYKVDSTGADHVLDRKNAVIFISFRKHAFLFPSHLLL